MSGRTCRPCGVPCRTRNFAGEWRIMWPSSEIWEYLTYRPKDLLMFSERVYYRMFEQYNQDIWPAQLLALGFGLLILFLILRPGLASGRVISAILGVIWLWVGWA